MFWVVPFCFSLLFWFPYWFWKENPRKTIRKPIPADSGTSPELPSEPLPPLASWAPLAGSGPLLPLSLSPVTRNKEEIRLWGLSGASVWASPSSVSLGSSGWLWPSPSSLCLLLCLVTKKSYSGASPELPSPSGPLPHLSFLFHALRREEKTYSGLPWTCSGPLLGTSHESLLVFWLLVAGYLGLV